MTTKTVDDTVLLPWIAWETKDQNREVRMYRPCWCGCSPGIGYLSGSDNKGDGITIMMPNEETYQRFLKVFGGDS